MPKKIALALLALVLTLAVGATAALARTAADPGVSDKEIVIGATTPLSGPFLSLIHI